MAKVVYENTDIFIGNFVDGNKHGKGVLTDQKENFRLQANYKMGIKDGPYHLIDRRDKENPYEEKGIYVNG